MGQIVTKLADEDSEVEVADEGDVVIDFSSPEGTKKAIALGKPLVCGTTGLDEDVMKELETLSKIVPVLYAPNFSLGMALSYEMLGFLKKNLDAEVFIEETHHTKKADTPSGSAKKMAEILETENVVSHRVDEVVGTHKVEFLFGKEKITLQHEALSREIFAQGAIAAAKFIFGKPPKFYSISDIFV
ncbi:MAG: dihydrodipicolinate reductase C-terminal domain-containing protein [Simkaniaceae bacterium]|nr:dihydrodipicolinate reductase C-terminal domain-containing protein [Candidatus Sacchlamyda saccharinae]